MRPPDTALATRFVTPDPAPAGARTEPLGLWHGGGKRVVDVLVSVVALVALAPILALLGLAVRLDSPGPCLFRQPRTGQGGRRFRLYKFRTMQWEVGPGRHVPATTSRAPRAPLTFRKPLRDARVTRLGAHLRRWSLDEVPNLVNVLRGEMSLVGPRPTGYSPKSYGPAATEILSVRPGITGLWQVSGRACLDFRQRILLDREYVRRCGMGLDLWILVRTVPAVLSGRGAY